MASQYIDQAGAELRYTKERVAQVFSSQDSSGATTGVADASAFNACAQDASTEIDERLATVYPVPFVAPYDPAIVEIAAQLTMYRGVQTRRPELCIPAKDGGRPVNPYESARKEAHERLDEIKQGQRRLASATRLTPANAGGVVTNYNASDAQPFYFSNQNPDNPGGGQTGY